MRGVTELNRASNDEAVAALLMCCSSAKWARSLVSQRPFQDWSDLLEKADETWWSLERRDWLEAFSGHPKIGERRQSATSDSDRWASQEQSGTSVAADKTLDALIEANQDYERRFGYIFIVCATGKSADEMLSILNQRFSNEPDTELRIAAEEQRRIMHLRLEKLLK